MIRSLSRVINALRMELRLPRFEESVSTLSRGFIRPNGDVSIKVTDTGYEDENGKDPFRPSRLIVLIDNENFITMTNAQSGALVKPASGINPGQVRLPASPEEGVYFTIATLVSGTDVIIIPNGNSIIGNAGELESVGEVLIENGAVTLVYTGGEWMVAELHGTLTFPTPA